MIDIVRHPSTKRDGRTIDSININTPQLSPGFDRDLSGIDIKTPNYVLKPSDPGYIIANGGNDSNTMLLLHLASDFKDSSSKNHVMTAYNNSALANTYWRFPPKSGQFPNGGSVSDYVDTPDSASLTFGSADFTLETWLFLPRANISRNIVLATDIPIGGADVGFKWVWTFSTFSGLSSIQFITHNGGTNTLDTINFPFSNFATVWHHHAVVRKDKVLHFFLDGREVSPITHSPGLGTAAIPHSVGTTFQVLFGNALVGTDPTLDIYLQEFRASNIARWTTNFTPMGVPYI